MVIDDNGQLWVGMRHFVLCMTPNGATFDLAWVVPSACVRVANSDYHCVCVGP